MLSLSYAFRRALPGATKRVRMMAVTMAVLFAISTPVRANVVISATRAIVPLPPGHTSLRLNNTSTAPTLVQIWADSGDAQSTPESADAPFEITPPLFVLGPNESQVVRIDYDDDPANAMLTRRESLYWLNVLDVPSTDESQEHAASEVAIGQDRDVTGSFDERNDVSSADNAVAEDDDIHHADKTMAGTAATEAANTAANTTASAIPNTTANRNDASDEDNALRFVVHTRIKLIARPRGLPGSALHAPGKVAWRIAPAPATGFTTLVGKNTSAYYVTCAPVFAIAADHRERNLGTHTLAPGDSLAIRLDPQNDRTAGDRQHANAQATPPWSEAVCHAINDYGSIDVFRSPLGEAMEDAE